MPKKNPICQARIYGEPPFAFCQTRHHRHHLKIRESKHFFLHRSSLIIYLSVRRCGDFVSRRWQWYCDRVTVQNSERALACGFRPRLKSSTATWKRVTHTFSETFPHRYNFAPIFRKYRSPRHDIWLRLLSLSSVSLLVSEKEVKCRKMFRAAIISSRDIYSACGSWDGEDIKRLKEEST